MEIEGPLFWTQLDAPVRRGQGTVLGGKGRALTGTGCSSRPLARGAGEAGSLLHRGEEQCTRSVTRESFGPAQLRGRGYVPEKRRSFPRSEARFDLSLFDAKSERLHFLLAGYY